MRRVAPALLVALAVVACGRKGPPVVPEARMPRAATDLSGLVRDGAIELSWTNPTRRADNSRLRDLSVARLFRTEDAGIGAPKPALLARGRIVGYALVATIPLPARGPRPAGAAAPRPAEAVVEDARVRFTDREAFRYGQRYTYVVVTEDTVGHVSPPSSRASVTFIAPPEPPPHLTAQAGDREVRLAWDPPTRLVDGSAVSGALAYEVLRATAAEAPLGLLTRAPLAETRFVDRAVENDRTYFYAVRAFRQEPGGSASGAPSARVAATPTTTAAPSAPTDLVAAVSAGTVRLSWRPSPERNVAAYLIYRASGGGDFVRIGAARAPATVFVDRDVAPGPYRYAVTAQDASPRANESARSPEVTVTVP